MKKLSGGLIVFLAFSFSAWGQQGGYDEWRTPEYIKQALQTQNQKKIRTILVQATQAGDLALVKRVLAEGAATQKVLDEALYVSSMNNEIEITKLLLEKGADSKVGSTPTPSSRRYTENP